MEAQKIEKLQGKDFILALWAFLYVVVINIFILPINLWIRSVKNLSNVGKEGFSNSADKTEFPVLLWVKIIFEAIIFFAWPFLMIFGLYQFFSKLIPFIRYVGFSLEVFFILGLPLLVCYSFPTIVSVIKELFNLVLVQVMKLEKIEENTKK